MAKYLLPSLTPSQSWSGDLPKLQEQHREIAVRNLDNLRAATSHFALGTHVSNHRQLGLEIQRFFELKMRTMLKTMNFIIDTIDKGEIAERDSKTGETYMRPLSLRDFESFQETQERMTKELAETMSLARGKLEAKDLLFPEGGLGPAAPAAPMPAFGVNIQQNWSPGPARAEPMEAREIDRARVEVVGEVVGEK